MDRREIGKFNQQNTSNKLSVAPEIRPCPVPFVVHNGLHIYDPKFRFQNQQISNTRHQKASSYNSHVNNYNNVDYSMQNHTNGFHHRQNTKGCTWYSPNIHYNQNTTEYGTGNQGARIMPFEIKSNVHIPPDFDFSLGSEQQKLPQRVPREIPVLQNKNKMIKYQKPKEKINIKDVNLPKNVFFERSVANMLNALNIENQILSINTTLLSKFNPSEINRNFPWIIPEINALHNRETISTGILLSSNQNNEILNYTFPGKSCPVCDYPNGLKKAFELLQELYFTFDDFKKFIHIECYSDLAGINLDNPFLVDNLNPKEFTSSQIDHASHALAYATCLIDFFKTYRSSLSSSINSLRWNYTRNNDLCSNRINSNPSGIDALYQFWGQLKE